MSQKRDASGVGAKGASEIKLYEEKPGDVPFLEFLAARKDAEKADIRAALGMLSREGHHLRPPHNEHLGDQIYYLRIDSVDGTYRVFYWPFGKGIVILGHGFSKKTATCPPSEIKKAKKLRSKFQADPDQHTYKGKSDADKD